MSGIVYLLGAGPGDPGLLTRKGQRLLENADAVLYDERVHPELLSLAPPAAERIHVGKRAHHASVPQERICAWMIARARSGLRVVRLKGGDPFVFGRGGEEAEALARAGIAWEAVPGVSAGIGAATAAGIPLTGRGHSAGVRFLTGYRSDPPSAGSPPDADETQVVFMGLERLETLAADLLSRGRSPRTPVAVIENGTLPQARVVSGRLDSIAVRVRRAAVQSPALIVVGDVVAWSRRLRPRSAPPARRRAAAASPPLPAIVLLAHGSPRAAWQRGVERVARQLALPGQFTGACYLPPVQPGLGDVVAAAVAAGARRLVVVPYFLAAGLHVTRDLPALVAAQRICWPRLRIDVAPCLDGHPALRTAVLARVDEALAAAKQGSPSRPAKVRFPPPPAPGRGRAYA